MTAPAAHSTEWRAYIGPPARPDTDSAFWNWASALTLDAAYSPETAIPPTTLAAALDVTGALGTFTLSTATSYPTAGGFWVSPGSASEDWGYIEYSGLNTGTGVGTVVRADTDDSEYAGTHASGSAVYFWWPITTDDGTFNLREFTEGDYVACNWRATCRGYSAPIHALRIGHLFLLQKRSYNYSTSAWGSWTNALVGFINTAKASDNADSEEAWDIEIVSSMGVYGNVKVDGVKVGNTQIQRGATVTASSTLANAYKAYNLQEFDGADPTLSPGNVVDGRVKPAWISERYVGQTNTPANPGSGAGAIATDAKIIISQIHVTKYPGQNDGYRWIELTVLDDNLPTGETYIQYSKTSTNGVGTYVLDYYFHLDLTSYSTGDRIIIAEVASLFNAENPDHDAAAVIDGASLKYYVGQPEQYLVSVQGATSGSFQVTDGFDDSGAISWNYTAAQVASALDYGSVDRVHGAGGPLPNNDVVVVFERPNSGQFYAGVSAGTVKAGYTINVTPTYTQIVDANNAIATENPAFAPGTVVDWFELIEYGRGGLTISYDDFGTWNTVRWGTHTVQPGLGDEGLWTGSNVAAITDPNTLRLMYSPTSPTQPADYWAQSEVHTPGYESNGAEWVLLELPGMGLSLAADANSGATSLSIEDAAGAATTNGLPDTGTVQIGAKQYTYTTNTRSTGILSGGFTATADHKEGDPVLLVVGGVATDAYPVERIQIERDTAVPEIENMNIYYSPYRVVRDGDEINFHLDYTSVTITAESGTNYSTATVGDLYVGTLDLSASNPRVKWLMVRITQMDGTPYRAAINEIVVDYDTSVFNTGDFLETGTVGTVMTTLLDSAGFPSLGYNDSTQTAVTGFTTERGVLWPILLDLADFGAKKIVVGRDSKVIISDNSLMNPGSSNMDATLPATSGTLTKDNTLYHEFDWLYTWGVGQVDLQWRSPDGLTEGTESYPSSIFLWGDTEVVGPYIYANATAAMNAAKRRYLQLRRPNNALWEIAGDGSAYRPLLFYAGTWDWTYRTMARTYMAEGVDHELKDGAWTTVVQTVQVSREDAR